MKRLFLIGAVSIALALVIYAGISRFANDPSQQSAPQSVDLTALEELRKDDMRKLLFSAAPTDAPSIPFTDPQETAKTFADFKGKTMVVNFWATWCAPCRKEMPSLEALRSALGDNADVIAIATGPKNEPQKIEGFYRKENITDLPYYLDPSSQLANAMGIRGLPITVILDPDGREVARLRGDADWGSENAIEVVQAIADVYGRGSNSD